MKNLKRAMTVLATTLFAVACGGPTETNQTTNTNTAPITTVATPSAPAPTPTPDEFAAARATYNASCIRCHKENGEGGVAELDAGATLKVPSFKEGHALEHTDAQFTRKIMKGGDGMPAFEKRLTPEQINELVRFIRQEFQAGLRKEEGTAAATPLSKH